MRPTFATSWTVDFQVPLFMGFPRQEYWSGLPFPPPGDVPNPEIRPSSSALAGEFFITEPPGKPMFSHCSVGRRQWHPTQYSCLENPMDGGAWWAAVHGVAKSRTLLSDFTFTFHFHALEKAMAPHSSTLAWRIPGMGDPGGLPSMGSHRVGHD